MEDIVDMYAQPAEPKVVYLAIDEKGKELQKEVRPPQPGIPGEVQRYDSEYARAGSCNLFVAYNWQSHQRHVQVTERRRGEDWAAFLYELAMVYYPQADRIVVVCDNLNIHDTASLYELYGAELARQIAKRFEFHYTPKHASWLNMAEIELSVLETECLARRLGSVAQVESEVAAWVVGRNRKEAGIDWQFTKEQAREKFKRTYPLPPKANCTAEMAYAQLSFEALAC